MKKMILGAFLALAAIVTLGAYVQPDPGGRDGFLVDTSTGSLVTMRAGTVVQTITSSGGISATDLTCTDDLSVGDDAAISGLATVGETLGVTGDATFGGGAGAITAVAAGSSLVCLDNSATGFVMGSSGNPNMLQLVTTTGGEKVVVEGTTTAVALHVDTGTLLVDESAAVTGLATVGGTLGVTDDATFAGGAGAITAVAAGSSLVCLDNSATGFVMGSSGNPNMLQLVTTTGGEKVVVEGTTTAVALHVDTGTALVDESLAVTGLATVGGTLGVTDDATFAGGAGAITAVAAGSSLVCLDNSATGFVMGSSGNPNMLQFDTQTGAEKIIVEGTNAAVSFHVDVGTALIDESLAVTGTTGLTGALTPAGGIVAAASMSAFPGGVAHTGGLPARVSTDGTNAALVNTEYYTAEVFVPTNMTITGISLFSGATVGTDSVHAALAYSDGSIVAGSATGAVATAGADAYQNIPFTGGAITVVGPATYFVVFIASGATDKYNAHPFGNFRAGKITGRTYQAITSFTPPSTFTADLGPIASLY